ncbi:hypothetical protein [Flavobacterium sp.]|jgi:hypothetical protein|uniref:hypothetical protein n=1 Tax=Flavobacterium sp. TaxID=239 RepID=UPI002A82BEBC|nr:hypothetical protein [Flavobacterium sp.]
MNKFYTFLAAILLTTSIFAQAPEKMSYQAVIRNSSDALVANQAVGMRISILQGSASGTAVYVETQTPTTNINGLVSLEIGTGTPVTGTFAGIDWAAGPYFIKTETDPTGSTTYTITGTSQLMSVPYALYAKTAENVLNSSWSTSGSDIYNSNTGNVAIGTSTPNPSAALEVNSTTGALLLPRMTEAQRDALTPEAGMMLYNTTSGKIQGYSSIGLAAGTVVEEHTPSVNTVFSSSGPGSPIGQSFQVSSNVNIGALSLKVDANGTVPFILTIRDGNGVSGTILYSENFTTSGAASGQVDTYVFTTNVPLVAGNIYTFVIQGSGGNVNYAVQGLGLGTYANGHAWNGVSPATGADFYFQLHGPSITTFGWFDF